MVVRSIDLKGAVFVFGQPSLIPLISTRLRFNNKDNCLSSSKIGDQKLQDYKIISPPNGPCPKGLGGVKLHAKGFGHP